MYWENIRFSQDDKNLIKAVIEKNNEHIKELLENKRTWQIVSTIFGNVDFVKNNIKRIIENPKKILNLF